MNQKDSFDMSNLKFDEITLGAEYDGLDVAVVGGYVRDKILSEIEPNAVNSSPSDVDLVVTGVTPDEMKEKGFAHIMSNDTRKPVFVDSEKREVAIARSEKSTGDEHDAFTMDVIPPHVSHSEAMRKDLERRDLTINAMAVDIQVDGEWTNALYDPFGGVKDLEKGVIRHVSGAFKGDPLRIIRAARYASRYGFTVSDDTLQMMSEMAPLVNALPTDRLGSELVKSFSKSNSPRMFFDILLDVEALKESYPEIAALDRVPSGPEKYHKEGSAYEHTMRVLTVMFERRGNDVNALLSALFHDIGKAATDPDTLPHHYGHANAGAKMATDLYVKYGFIKDRKGIIRDSSRIHMQLNKLDSVNVTTVLKYAKMIDDSPLSVEQMLDLGFADAKGREPNGDFNRDEMKLYIETAISVIHDVGGHEALKSRGLSSDDVGTDELPGEKVGNLIRQDRAEELRFRLR